VWQGQPTFPVSSGPGDLATVEGVSPLTWIFEWAEKHRHAGPLDALMRIHRRQSPHAFPGCGAMYSANKKGVGVDLSTYHVDAPS